MLIGMANTKGGCAKSTTSVHLLHWLAMQGKTVALIDADVQATSSMWASTLGLSSDVRVESIDPDPELLFDLAQELNADFEFVVIDGPGGMTEVIRMCLLTVDLAVLPIQATGPDVRAAGSALKLLKSCQDIRKGDPRAVSYLTRVNRRTKAAEGARASLLKQDIAPLLNGMVSHRQIVQDGYSTGKTSFSHESGPGLEAANEFKALFTEMLPDV